MEDVGSHNEPEHGESKEGEERVVALESLFAVHVSEAVEVDHQRDCSDDDKHHRGNRVDEYTEVDGKPVAEGQPSVVEHVDRLANAVDNVLRVKEISKRYGIGNHRSDEHCASTDNAGNKLGQFDADESQEEEHKQRQEYCDDRIR